MDAVAVTVGGGARVEKPVNRVGVSGKAGVSVYSDFAKGGCVLLNVMSEESGACWRRKTSRRREGAGNCC